jgi:hypothetical protein
MALSNAQRQQRHRQRLKEKSSGVTVEQVVRAARLMHAAANEHGEYGDWEGLLKVLAKKPHLWTQWLPDRPEESYSQFGADAPLMKAVAKVVHAILYPPPPA